MARCSGREHPRGTTFALRMNGRMRFVSHRYCGSKTSISPNFVCQRSFFTLAMHRRLLTNFSLRRFDLVLGPALYRRPPQKPHFLDNPLFDRVGLLEISLRIRYRHRYRYESIAKTRVRLKNCRKRRVAEFRRRHLSTAVRKWPKTSGLKLLRRPQLSVDLMVANNGWTACPVKAVSRRRRGPKASLYRARRPAKLDHQGRREATLKRHAARQFQTGDFR